MTSETLVIITSGTDRDGRITDGELLTVLVLRMDRRAAPGSLLRSFERHLRARNRSERTVGNYLESAWLSQAFLEGRGTLLEQATQADLEDFLADILRRRSANTAATRYKVLRVLYRWLEEEEEHLNPMARMRPPIVPERPVPIVPADGLRRLRPVAGGSWLNAAAASTDCPEGQTWRGTNTAHWASVRS
jgi:integrase